MKRNFSEETLEKIVADKMLFHLTSKETAERHGFSRAFVDATVAAYKAVSAGEWEKVRFMLDGAQCNIKTVEWAAKKCGVSVPDAFYVPKEEPKPVLQPLDGQTRLDEFGKKIDGDTVIKFGTSANNTLHALIDALNRNADEAAQLRSAVFALLNSAAVVD